MSKVWICSTFLETLMILLDMLMLIMLGTLWIEKEHIEWNTSYGLVLPLGQEINKIQ